MPDMPAHIAASLPLSYHGLEREGLIARGLFGSEFFVSHDHGMQLPCRLRERLEQAGFRIFLDQMECVAGDDLRRETRRQAVKSCKNVVIGCPADLKAEQVRREVDVAVRRIMPG